VNMLAAPVIPVAMASTTIIQPQCSESVADPDPLSQRPVISTEVVNPTSILRTSLSLEPASQSSTPRENRVQFNVIEGVAHGGRGKTEFSKTQSRKSHTKREFPPGMFDTDSDQTVSDVDEPERPRRAPHPVDYAVVNKFMVNSRLYKVVRNKKKKKKKEEKWLSMISPEGATATKTQSRTSSAPNVAVNHKLNRAPSQKGGASKANTDRDRLKSPSRCMSRGRRALLKAKKEIKRTPPNKKKVPGTPSLRVKGTPMVTAVNRIAQRLDHRQRMNTLREKGHDADDDDDDIVMNDQLHRNNGSMEPRSPTLGTDRSANASGRASKTQRDDAKDQEEDGENEQDLEQTFNEMVGQLRPDNVEEDHAAQSDELKIDDECPPQTDHKRLSFTLSTPIGVEDAAESEDDDLDLEQLDTLRAGQQLEALFMPKAKEDSLHDDINAVPHRVNAGSVDMDSAPSSSEESKEAQDSQRGASLLSIPESSQIATPPVSRAASCPLSATTGLAVADECCRGIQIESKEQSIPSLPDTVSQPMPSQKAPSPKPLTVYSRSIGTQTDHILCSIGIQTDDATENDLRSKHNEADSAMMANPPKVIVTASGNKYVLITDTDTDTDPDCNRSAKSEAKNQRNDIKNANSDRNQEQKEEEDASHRNLSVDTDQLESLSLSAKGSGTAITSNKRKRSRLKRKFDSISDRGGDEESKTPDETAKRRRVGGQQTRFQKKDIVWATENGQPEPVIIISCQWKDESEKWYPSHYELLWLRWIDNSNENGRMGQCSVTVEAADKVINKLTETEFARLTKQFDDAAKAELKRWRPDVYRNFYNSADRRRNKPASTKPSKARRRRRMSVL